MANFFCCRMPNCGSNSYLPIRIFGNPDQARMSAGGIQIAIGKVNDLIAEQDCLYMCARCSTIFANPDKFSLSPQEQLEKSQISKTIEQVRKPGVSEQLNRGFARSIDEHSKD